MNRADQIVAVVGMQAEARLIRPLSWRVAIGGGSTAGAAAAARAMAESGPAAVGGFGLCGVPIELIDALVASGAGDLRVVLRARVALEAHVPGGERVARQGPGDVDHGHAVALDDRPAFPNGTHSAAERLDQDERTVNGGVVAACGLRPEGTRTGGEAHGPFLPAAGAGPGAGRRRVAVPGGRLVVTGPWCQAPRSRAIRAMPWPQAAIWLAGRKALPAAVW